MRLIQGEGPIPSRIMLIGEAPGDHEESSGHPFDGPGGRLLNEMLSEAGIMRSECYATYVVKTRPANNNFTLFLAKTKKEVTPDMVQLRGKHARPEVLSGYAQLLAEIQMVQPQIIITFGNLPLWVLTGAENVVKWRGSQLNTDEGIKLIPTIHPMMIFRDWSFRSLVVSDLKRAKKGLMYDNWPTPDQNLRIRPSISQVELILKSLLLRLEKEPLWIEFDLETSISTKHIRCAGISWSSADALCIPITTDANREGYWNGDEESLAIYLLYKVLTHPNARVRGQNLLFDCQYTYRYWHFIPNVAQDTMISQHSAFCALPKGLDFLASMYCENYRQWKTISWKGC